MELLYIQLTVMNIFFFVAGSIVGGFVFLHSQKEKD